MTMQKSFVIVSIGLYQVTKVLHYVILMFVIIKMPQFTQSANDYREKFYNIIH
jgi:hypothetical protein